MRVSVSIDTFKYQFLVSTIYTKRIDLSILSLICLDKKNQSVNCFLDLSLLSKPCLNNLPSGHNSPDVGRRPLSDFVGGRAVDAIDAEVFVRIAGRHRHADEKKTDLVLTDLKLHSFLAIWIYTYFLVLSDFKFILSNLDIFFK